MKLNGSRGGDSRCRCAIDVMNGGGVVIMVNLRDGGSSVSVE